MRFLVLMMTICGLAVVGSSVPVRSGDVYIQQEPFRPIEAGPLDTSDLTSGAYVPQLPSDANLLRPGPKLKTSKFVEALLLTQTTPSGAKPLDTLAIVPSPMHTADAANVGPGANAVLSSQTSEISVPTVGRGLAN